MKTFSVLPALCVSLCMASSMSSSNDEANQELFMKRILNILNRDKVPIGLKWITQYLCEDSDCNDFSKPMSEYKESIENDRDRGLRQSGIQKYKHTCEQKTLVYNLSNDKEYEYRPTYIEEVRCVSTDVDYGIGDEGCSSPGFACIQWNKTMSLARRRYSSHCWEFASLEVSAGCECVQPNVQE